MGSPRQEYWSGLSFPTPEDLPKPGIKPARAGRFFTTSTYFCQSVQSLSCVWLFATPWTAACQASLSVTLDLHNTILYNYSHSCSKDRPCERIYSAHKRLTCLFQIFMLTAIIITISWFRKLFPLSFIFIIFNSNYWKFYDIKLEAKASRLACISSEIKWYFALPRTSQSHIHSRVPSVMNKGLELSPLHLTPFIALTEPILMKDPIPLPKKEKANVTVAYSCQTTYRCFTFTWFTFRISQLLFLKSC